MDSAVRLGEYLNEDEFRKVFDCVMLMAEAERVKLHSFLDEDVNLIRFYEGVVSFSV